MIGPTGPAGVAGTRGNEWHIINERNPISTDGVDGDLVLRGDTGEMWQKNGTTWTARSARSAGQSTRRCDRRAGSAEQQRRHA